MRNGRQWIPLDIKWHPITTTPTSTATASTTDLAATTTIGAGGDRPEQNVKVLGGELGKVVTFLSDDQTTDLLDRRGLEIYDYYVEKLATFILDRGACVKNHYEMILKWWLFVSKISSKEGNAYV